MKKSVLFLTAALSFGVAGAQTTVTTTAAQAPALTDVPAGHWAKDAVERLVSQGIILGYPDGTYRGTQNLTRYEAAMIISRLLDQVGSGEVDLGKVDDATMASIRNAINELSAELAALDVRVSDLEDSAVSREDFARLEGRVDAIANTDAGKVAEDLAAVNEMATLLNQDVLELQDRVTAVDGELASFDERLGVVEDQVAENTTDIDAQGIRIADLENGRVRLTLGVGGSYGQLRRVNGDTNFDVDRVTEGTFAEKQYTNQTAADDDATDRVRGVDTTNEGRFDLSPAITVGVKATNIAAAGGVTVEEAGVNFGFDPSLLTNSVKLGEAVDTTNRYVTYLDSAEVTGRIGDDARFRVVAKAGTVPARPDVVNPVGSLKDVPGYNDYLLPSGVRNGVSAGVALTDVPLSPTLYISSGYGDNAGLTGTYLATRAETKLGDRGDVGVSFVQNFSDAATQRTGRTAFGVDGRYAVPKAADSDETLYGVKAVYVASMPDAFSGARTFQQAFDSRDQAAELSAEANFFNLGARADFRAVSPGFENTGADNKLIANAAMDVNRTDAFGPNYVDEVGYGASVSTQLGRAELGLAADTYTNWYDRAWANRRSTLGGHIGTNLGAFRVAGFAGYTTDARDNKDLAASSGFLAPNSDAVRYDADKVTSVRSADKDRSRTIFAPAKVSDLYRYSSGAGVLVTHDGTAANALVPNLDLAALGETFTTTGDTYGAGFAAYNLKATPELTVAPFIGGSVYNQQAPNRGNAADNTQIKGGVNLSTQPLDLAFQPQFRASLAGARYTTGLVDNNTVIGSELGAKAEVTLNQFFSPAAKLSLGYGFHQANNLRDNLGAQAGLPNLGASSVSPSVADFRFGGAVAAPRAVANGNYTQTQGIYSQLAWNEALKFNYGVFRFDEDTRTTTDPINVAHGFKVSYGVKF
ncbi:S-layer domain-containing protein [Deinococcus proteolyticus MRP]|uniref:S-layer domain-containing protein n=1 Tax=Deinococcus proteolyticus (strain ATCC 35074 / DSM 20540 / JCM 6276 / NBRC 101906 / NCIMB 13154 / VKM Ac-1939 / CCM 2703 / MRP) TaxID=693977 RepID=F0RNN1_DEIPM|nr:S-layer homology domain-containing protein [Deinococcus proteolyticus]ADY25264.1 S-layer domain-containing protein [Deinococcus proteolyticus MRP]